MAININVKANLSCYCFHFLYLLVFNNYTIAPQQNRYRDGHHITQNTAIYDTDYTELHGITQIMTRIYFS
ncbi:hypothetical protein VPH207E341_0022 [Vibrio phage 207E34-1]